MIEKQKRKSDKPSQNPEEKKKGDVGFPKNWSSQK